MWLQKYVCMCAYFCASSCVWVCQLCVNTCVCVCVCVSVCVCVCVCISVCMYPHSVINLHLANSITLMLPWQVALPSIYIFLIYIYIYIKSFSRHFCPKRRTRDRTVKLRAIET